MLVLVGQNCRLDHMFFNSIYILFVVHVIAARMWSPYKELYHVVDSAICRKQADAIQELEIVLRKHKPDFISLLQNPVSY